MVKDIEIPALITDTESAAVTTLIYSKYLKFILDI
jgi:hypothetical protein